MIWTMTGEQPCKPMSLNDRWSHWAQQAAAIKEWRTAAWAYSLQRGRPKITGLAIVQLDVGTKCRVRDPGNLAPTIKACVDGMTDAGLWVDDDARHVATLEPRIVADIRPTEFRITITWEDPE